jgi:hypothetical protein
MRIERAPGQTSLLEMLDRVLDKGLVIDDWVGASPINWKAYSSSNRALLSAAHRSRKWSKVRAG